MLEIRIAATHMLAGSAMVRPVELAGYVYLSAVIALGFADELSRAELPTSLTRLLRDIRGPGNQVWPLVDRPLCMDPRRRFESKHLGYSDNQKQEVVGGLAQHFHHFNAVGTASAR